MQNAFIFPCVCKLLDAHVPFVYLPCILDDCFQVDHPGSRAYARVVLKQIIDHVETQEKVAASSVSFFFFFWVVHSLLAREAVTTKLALFFHWTFSIYILKTASNVSLNPVQYFLSKHHAPRLRNSPWRPCPRAAITYEEAALPRWPQSWKM